MLSFIKCRRNCKHDENAKTAVTPNKTMSSSLLQLPIVAKLGRGALLFSFAILFALLILQRESRWLDETLRIAGGPCNGSTLLSTAVVADSSLLSSFDTTVSHNNISSMTPIAADSSNTKSANNNPNNSIPMAPSPDNVYDPQFPLTSADNLEWVRDVLEVVACGKFKCVFRSRKFPDTYGYIASQTDISIQVLASELARNLASEIGIRQFYIGPPHRISCSEQPLAGKLALKLNRMARRSRKSTYQYWRCSDPESNLILQPIRLIQTKCCVELKLATKKDEEGSYNKLENFFVATQASSSCRELNGMEQNGTERNGTELQRFKEQLQLDIDALEKMLWKRSCLTIDFQILVDPWTGRIYHYDFDRCWQSVNYPAVFKRMREDILRQVKRFTDVLLKIHHRREMKNHPNNNTTT
mmetsp:Transcript_11185/g.12810  ORF Transcript_11185/g.12810 Transcript_11185/m.12810 type:complete len:414 (-) Transcript_11185:223-1464(-)